MSEIAQSPAQPAPLPSGAGDGEPSWAAKLEGRLVGYRGLLVAALILAALVANLHRAVLFEGAVYHMDDAADNYYPARVAFARALSEGTLPSWEPNAMGGWPLLADPYYGYFYPLNVVFFLGKGPLPPAGTAASVAAGLGLAAALHVWLAGLGMFVYLRRRLSFGAALFGAIAFALSSFLVVRIRHIIYIQMMAWLPFLLAAIDSYIESRRPLSLVACALCTGLLLLAGAHSLLHFVVLLFLLYTPARLLRGLLAEPPPRRLRWLVGTVAGLLGAAATGAMLAAVALLPTLFAMPQTARALGTDYAFASSYAWPTWRYVLTLLMPDMLGVGEWRQSSRPWLGPWNHWELAGYYQGALVTLLALPGALLRRRTVAAAAPLAQRLELERLALLALCAVGVLAALGAEGPVHPLLFRYFPLYGALRCPSRALCLLVVALPILGAHAADWLWGGRASLAGWARWQRLAIPLGAATAGLGWLAVRAVAESALRAPPALLYVGQGRAHLLAVVMAALVLLVLRWLGRLPGLLSLGLLGALTAADQLPIDRGYLQPKPADFAAGTERFSAVDWLLTDQQAPSDPPDRPTAKPYRFVGDLHGPFRLLALGETLGMESASGYGSVLVWRYVHLLYILHHRQPYPFPKLRDDLAAAGLYRFDSPIIDLLNIRYLVAAEPPSPSWRERFTPELNARPHARYEPYWDERLRVFENPTVMPRTYVAYQARLGRSEAEEAQLVARSDFDPHREIVLGVASANGSRAAALSLPAVENRGRVHGQAQLLSHQRQRLVIEAEAAAPGILVVADTYYPGWTATVDGQPQPIWPVNLAQRGVALSPGRHRIELVYRDRALRWGALLTALGGLGLLALLVAARRRR